MTHQEEQFLHFVQSIQNLNNAWVILQVLKDYKGSPHLINAAFQFALIEYSKPYKFSYGKVLDAKGKTLKYRLDGKHLPSEHVALHNRILDARDQIHAHNDLTVLDAKVYVRNTPYGNIAGHIQNTIHGTEEMRNLDAIIDLIEQTLDSMYKEEKKLEQQLPANT